MHRRRYLALAATAAGLAGCTNGDGGSAATDTPISTTQRPTATDMTTESEATSEVETLTVSQEASTHIRNARDDLQRATEEWETALDEFDIQSNWRFDASVIRAALDSAEGELDTASESANGSQQETIAQLRTYATFIREVADSTAAFSQALQQWNTASSYDKVGRYDDAVAELESAQDAITEASDQLEAAFTTSDELRKQYLGEISYQSVQSMLEAYESVIFAVETILKAAVDIVRAREAYERGSDLYENGEYGEADDHFRTAHRRYSSARDTLEEAEGDVTADYGLKSYFITQICKMDRWQEIAIEMARAADDWFLDRPEEARQHEQNAQDISTSC